MDLGSAQRTLDRHGIKVPVTVSSLLQRDASRIRADQTQTTTLQREYPHPTVPSAVFEISPGALALIGSIAFVSLKKFRPNRRRERQINQAVAKTTEATGKE